MNEQIKDSIRIGSNLPRRDYIDTMKGFAILMVVAGHFMEYYRQLPVVNSAFESIYLFHMAAFCICSGLVAKFNPRKLLFQQVWLYVIAQGGMLIFAKIALHDDSALTLHAMLSPWRHMWYLYALIVWNLTVPVLKLVVRRFRTFGAVGAMVLITVLGLLSGTREWSMIWNRVLAFYPFFALGVLFPEWVDRWQAFTARHWSVRFLSAGLLAGLYLPRFLRVSKINPPQYLGHSIWQDTSYALGNYTWHDRLSFYLIGIVTTLLLAAVLGSEKTLGSLGKRTLPVYILHMPMYALLAELGAYECVRDKGMLPTLIWITFAAAGSLSLFASAPFCGAFDFVANFWYKALPNAVKRLWRKINTLAAENDLKAEEEN